MKVAMGMQKQITAKRGQIDALQNKIQFLEEAMTNSNKVNTSWNGRICSRINNGLEDKCSRDAK